MTPSLREITKKIISAIRGIEGLSPADVLTFVFKARESCVSLESAQDLIDDLQLPVIIGEDLAQAIQAEKGNENVVDPAKAQDDYGLEIIINEEMTICAHAETDLAKASMENTMANANRKRQVTLLADAHTTELTGSGLSTDLMGPGPLTEETGPGPPTKLTGSGFPTPYRRAIFTCRQCFQIICRRHRHGVIVRVLIHRGCRPPPAPNLESIFRRTRDRSNFGG